MAGPATKQPRKSPGRPFPPGVSGNSRGRPKTAPELKARLAEGGQKALEHIIAVLDDAEADVRRKDWAAAKLLEFSTAKPAPEATSAGEKDTAQAVAEFLRGDG